MQTVHHFKYLENLGYKLAGLYINGVREIVSDKPDSTFYPSVLNANTLTLNCKIEQEDWITLSFRKVSSAEYYNRFYELSLSLNGHNLDNQGMEVCLFESFDVIPDLKTNHMQDVYQRAKTKFLADKIKLQMTALHISLEDLE